MVLVEASRDPLVNHIDRVRRQLSIKCMISEYRQEIPRLTINQLSARSHYTSHPSRHYRMPRQGRTRTENTSLSSRYPTRRDLPRAEAAVRATRRTD
jgi:hypothetical protein